jgi:hypothetical protein
MGAVGDVLAQFGPAVFVIAALVGVLLYAVGVGAPTSARAGDGRANARRFSFLRRYGDPTALGSGSVLLAGFVAAAALASTVAALRHFVGFDGGGTAIAIGALAGVATAILARSSPGRTMLAPGLEIAGFVGSIAVITSYIVTVRSPAFEQCTSLPSWMHIATTALIIIIAFAGVALTVLKSGFRKVGLLGAFAAIEVGLFLASPFGIPLLDLPPAAWWVSLVMAIGFTALAAFLPVLGIPLAALAITFTTLGVETAVGGSCIGTDSIEISLVIAYAIGAVLAVLVSRALFRRAR